MFKDVDGTKLEENDTVELFPLRGIKNAKSEFSSGIKTIKLLTEMGGTKVAYFKEGGSCHACDALRKK